MRRVAEIDVSRIQTSEQLHHLLSVELRFPGYYGNNWDAFDECVSDPELDLPAVVRVRGMAALARALPRDAELLRRCASRPDAIPSFEWLPQGA